MTESITSAAYRASRRHKYGAVATLVDGICFASKAEAARYAELRLLEHAGQIADLRLQPAYLLFPAFVDRTGTTYRAITYVADFAYTEAGFSIVEDVKGVQTAVYKLKAKLFRAKYPDLDYRVLVCK